MLIKQLQHIKMQETQTTEQVLFSALQTTSPQKTTLVCRGAWLCRQGRPSAGTPVEAATTNNIGAAFDPDNNKVVIAYRDDGNSEYGTAIVGTVNNSDNSTFGTPTVFESARSDHNKVITILQTTKLL